MQMSYARNSADALDGSLVKFSSAKDFSAFTLTSAVWDDDSGCLKVNANGSSEPAAVESPVVEVTGAFDHLIASWNAVAPLGSFLTVYARARVEGQWTKWYVMGIWNRGGCPQHRTSVKGQEDDFGTVDCDVLKLKKPATAFSVKVELSSADGKTYPCLRFLAVNVIDSASWAADDAPRKAVWGTELDVPELCQISVDGGGGWCSPTSTAMVLGYWSEKLRRPDMSVGITETAQACHDEAWGGTGNWPFNTAHAAEFAGIRGYVTRFASVSQIEQWVAKGVPVVVSLHASRLRREDSDTDPGHLMVVRGFTESGDPIFNDPWARLANGEKLRKIFPRNDLEYAWLGPNGSWGTVYLIYPEDF